MSDGHQTDGSWRRLDQMPAQGLFQPTEGMRDFGPGLVGVLTTMTLCTSFWNVVVRGYVSPGAAGGWTTIFGLGRRGCLGSTLQQPRIYCLEHSEAAPQGCGSSRNRIFSQVRQGWERRVADSHGGNGGCPAQGRPLTGEGDGMLQSASLVVHGVDSLATS
jgi:hypothetical protein